MKNFNTALVLSACLLAQAASAESIIDKVKRLRENAFLRQECKTSVENYMGTRFAGTTSKQELYPTDRNDVIIYALRGDHGADLYEVTVDLSAPGCPVLSDKATGGIGN